MVWLYSQTLFISVYMDVNLGKTAVAKANFQYAVVFPEKITAPQQHFLTRFNVDGASTAG